MGAIMLGKGDLYETPDGNGTVPMDNTEEVLIKQFKLVKQSLITCEVIRLVSPINTILQSRCVAGKSNVR